MATKIGTGASETITGTNFKDTISGKGGNDTLYGLAGGDTLYGGGGNDILIGGAGTDTLWGGEGTDTFKYLARSDSRGTTVDLIKDVELSTPSEGGDIVDLTALGTATLESQYYAAFTGLQAVFTYDFYDTGTITTLSYYQGSSTPIFQLKFTGSVSYGPWDEENLLGIKISTSPTAGDDQLIGTPGNDTINAGEGNDIISGDAGSDTLRGGAGNDELQGGDDLAADFLYGDGGNDRFFVDTQDHVFGGAGDDFMWLSRGEGGSGPGQIVGGDGYDEIFGPPYLADIVDAAHGQALDASGNVLFTFSGIEVFYGSVTTFIGSNIGETVTTPEWANAATIFGNGGDDYILTGEGGGRISGGAGNDHISSLDSTVTTAVYSGNRADYIITVYDPFGQEATVQQIGGGGDGTDTLRGVGFLEFADGTFKVTDFKPANVPTEGADYFAGTEGNDTIDLLGGNDTYFGLGGHDRIAGGNGDDELSGDRGNDNIGGGSGDDSIDGGAGTDILYGGAGNDIVYGGFGNDTVYGGDGSDLLNDGYGDDYVFGQLGNDGFETNSGNDTLNGGEGYDTVYAGAFRFYSITKNLDGTVTLADTSLGVYDTDTLVGIEAIQFNDGLYIVATGQFTPSDAII